MRLLVLGDSAGTGFGTVTRDLGSALLARGVDLRILSMNENAGAQTDKGWPEALRERIVMLGHKEGWAALRGMDAESQARRDALLAQAQGVYTGSLPGGWTPEGVLFIGDPASFAVSPWPQWLPDGMPALHYVPIEGIDLPPAWRGLWERIKPVAMCEFGADQLAVLNGERPPVVYHGVDPESFWQVSGTRPLLMRTRKMGPVRLTSRAECRRFLGWSRHETILFRADRHMPRKQYPAMLRALAPILRRHASVRVIMHCLSDDEGGSLPVEVSKYPDIADRISTTGHHDRGAGVPRAMLTAMYNAADLYISTGAEGFGLTIAESLACGTPAVGLDYSSVPEVIGPAGIVVGANLIDNIYSYYWVRPNEDEYTAAVEALVMDPTERRRLGALGPSHIARFRWDVAAERFESLFAGQPVGEPAPEPPVAARMAALGLVGARA